MIFKLKAGVALGALIVVAGGVHAQNAEITETDDGEARQQTVVVTGQKIERSLQDTQASVEVITELDIREENIIDIVDAIERTANVTTNDGSGFTIRGISNVSVSGAGQGNLATIYVDGFALPRTALFGAPLETWDLSQIEILRGPQSTLQGRASLAGAIIVNTADPTYEWTGRGRVIYTTEENGKAIAGAVGGPIIEDQVAFRFAGERRQSDGFSTNTFLGVPSDPIEAESIRTKLLIEPDAIPGLEVLLSYSKQTSSDGDSFNSLAVNDPEEAREIELDTKTRFDSSVTIATAIIDYEFNENWSATFLTGWNEVEYDFLTDVSRDATNPAFNIGDQAVETIQNEFRLTYQGDSIEAIAGFFISDEDTPNNVNSSTVVLDLTGPVSIIAANPAFGLDAATQAVVVGAYSGDFFLTSDGILEQQIETSAIFADGSWEINDQWTLYGGFRYDVETQSNATEVVNVLQTPLPQAVGPLAPLAPVFNVIDGIVASEVASSNSAPCDGSVLVDGELPAECGFESDEFGGFLPKFGIGYDIDDDRSLSFTVQRGYRSGGTAINASNSTAYQFDQEFTWNYELAFRSQWFDRALTLNSNLFYVDWTDQQQSVQLDPLNPFDVEIQNAASSTLYGFEIEGYYIATDDLDLYGSIGYAKTEFEDFFVSRGDETIDFSGNEFPRAPEWTLNAGATWRPGENWIANVNANYASSSYLRGDDFQLNRDVDARTLVNFRTGWENENFGIYLTGNNLLDEDYRISQFPNISSRIDPNLPSSFDNARAATPNFAQFGDPRTFSIQLETRF
ncbi:MAG: TonB-dependent receptor [Pseudomonadota bacterium]